MFIRIEENMWSLSVALTVGARWATLSSETADPLVNSYRTAYRVYSEWCKKRINTQWAAVARLARAQDEKNNYSYSNPEQKSISYRTTRRSSRQDGPQEQKTRSGSTPGSQVGRGSSELDSWKLVWCVSLFCRGTQMVGSESGINSMNLWTQPALCQPSRLLVVVGGPFGWHTLGPLLPINHFLSQSVVADHVHPFMATIYSTSTTIMHHKANLKLAVWKS